MNASATTGSSAGSRAKQRVWARGFGRRLLATLWDGLFVLFLTFVLVMAWAFIGLFYASFNPYQEYPILERMTFWTALLVSAFYYIGMWSSTGSTIGKNIMGIKVVRSDGKPPSLGWAILRYIGYIINIIVFSIGFLWIEFNKNRRGWHDLIAGTYVVDIEADFKDIDQVELVPEDPKRTWIWIVVWIIVAISPISLAAASLVVSPLLGRLLATIFGVSQ